MWPVAELPLDGDERAVKPGTPSYFNRQGFTNPETKNKMWREWNFDSASQCTKFGVLQHLSIYNLSIFLTSTRAPCDPVAVPGPRGQAGRPTGRVTWAKLEVARQRPGGAHPRARGGAEAGHRAPVCCGAPEGPGAGLGGRGGWVCACGGSPSQVLFMT